MKVAIIGTHGIGKTTFAYQIAAEAKKRGRNASVVKEVARKCPFPLDVGFTTDGAEWIITSQINKELGNIAQKYDCIVCDRSAYDPICYLKASNRPQRNYDKLESYSEEWLKTYDLILFVLPAWEKIIDDGIRCMDREFQEQVHDEFKKFVLQYTGKNLIRVSAKRVFEDDMDEIYQRVFS